MMQVVVTLVTLVITCPPRIDGARDNGITKLELLQETDKYDIVLNGNWQSIEDIIDKGWLLQIFTNNDEQDVKQNVQFESCKDDEMDTHRKQWEEISYKQLEKLVRSMYGNQRALKYIAAINGGLNIDKTRLLNKVIDKNYNNSDGISFILPNTANIDDIDLVKDLVIINAPDNMYLPTQYNKLNDEIATYKFIQVKLCSILIALLYNSIYKFNLGIDN